MFYSVSDKYAPNHGIAVIEDNIVDITLLNGKKKKLKKEDFDRNWIVANSYDNMDDALKNSIKRSQIISLNVLSSQFIRKAMVMEESIKDEKEKAKIHDIVQKQSEIYQELVQMLK